MLEEIVYIGFREGSLICKMEYYIHRKTNTRREVVYGFAIVEESEACNRNTEVLFHLFVGVVDTMSRKSGACLHNGTSRDD